MTIDKCKTWVIKCPICINSRLVDVSKQIPPSMIIIYPPMSHEEAEYFVKCQKCKSQIGIKIKH